jgi:replicative DNA helicase
MGKTAFALNIAGNAAIKNNVPVALFSLEMSNAQLAMRMLCTEARISSQNIRQGRIRSDDWGKISMACGLLSKAPVYIDDTPGITFAEMRSKARKLNAEVDLGIIFIDYLQLMSGSSSGKSESRQQEVSEISRNLKGLARELQLPVIALSQLSRAVESRHDKRPMLSDLRESGAIEQDADIVMFLYRDDYYNKEESDSPGITEVLIAKQRNGPVGTAKLYFNNDETRFADLSHDQF